MSDLIPTKVLLNKEEKIIEVPKMSFLCHQQDIRVNVPDFLEINSRKTIRHMEEMKQDVWKEISKSILFQELFYTVFEKEIHDLPETIEELNEKDYGVIHVCGLIILSCEAIFNKSTKLFFRTPEDHLHPKQQQKLVDMLNKLQLLSN